MREKKDRERFCIKFNARDPVHRKAIEILEGQSPHGKAQFVANAVLCYADHLEKPETSQMRTAWMLDEEYVKRLVREILVCEAAKPLMEGEKTESKGEPDRISGLKGQDIDSRSGTGPDKNKPHGLESMDADVMSLITATMSEFRNY